MNNEIKVTIYDTEGNCLLNDNVSSPFVGLQAGETFWFGSGGSRNWAKIIKITYGLDTNSKYFVIEIVVENTEKKETKNALPDATTVDLGEKKIVGKDGGSWAINNSDIIVTVGTPGIYGVKVFTLQINTPNGPEMNTRKDANAGEFIEIKNRFRKVICTITQVGPHEFTTVRVTETKFL